MDQAYAVAAIVFLALLGLAAANLLHDIGAPPHVSRAIAPVLGGVGYLVAVLWLEKWTAIALSGAMTILIVSLRLGFRERLRGVTGNAPAQAWAEIAYPLAGTASLAVGWGLLGDRWLAFLPIAFMAWGDSVAGLTRGFIQSGMAEKIVPLSVMLGTSLAVAVLFQPYWIGALGAVVAAAAEAFRPTSHPIWDDNWVVAAASLAVMGLLVRTAL